MNRRRWYPIAPVAAALVLALACGGDDSTGPAAGTLVVSLTTPNSDDGGILFSVTGGEINTPTELTSSYVVFSRATGLTSINGVVVGDITAGSLATFEVPDIDQASSYTATIIEVATRDNALRESLDDYSLSISRP